jgi:hypothetical protein
MSRVITVTYYDGFKTEELSNVPNEFGDVTQNEIPDGEAYYYPGLHAFKEALPPDNLLGKIQAHFGNVIDIRYVSTENSDGRLMTHNFLVTISTDMTLNDLKDFLNNILWKPPSSPPTWERILGIFKFARGNHLDGGIHIGKNGGSGGGKS